MATTVHLLMRNKARRLTVSNSVSRCSGSYAVVVLRTIETGGLDLLVRMSNEKAIFVASLLPRVADFLGVSNEKIDLLDCESAEPVWAAQRVCHPRVRFLVELGEASFLEKSVECRR
jgi:hypothetical protein